jgi:hypothetical protein
MSIASFALAALLSIVPSQALSGTVLSEAHLDRFADDIALAAELGPIPFGGPAAAEGTALVLLVIAEHEGARFDPRVENCQRVADQGQTVSLFGLMRGASWQKHLRAELCQGGPLPAYLALAAFRGYQVRCRPMPIGWFRGYASGSCSVKSDAAAAMCSRWEQLAKARGISGASCWRAAPLTFHAGHLPGSAEQVIAQR